MFDIYIKKAIKNQSLTQNELAKKIGISNACMSKMKTAKILPSEETLLKVAALAGIPAEKALIDLNLWRSKDDAARLEVWQRISKIIKNIVPMLLILYTLYGADCILYSTENVYYVNSILLLLIYYQSFKICCFKINFYNLKKSNT